MLLPLKQPSRACRHTISSARGTRSPFHPLTTSLYFTQQSFPAPFCRSSPVSHENNNKCPSKSLLLVPFLFTARWATCRKLERVICGLHSKRSALWNNCYAECALCTPSLVVFYSVAAYDWAHVTWRSLFQACHIVFYRIHRLRVIITLNNQPIYARYVTVTSWRRRSGWINCVIIPKASFLQLKIGIHFDQMSHSRNQHAQCSHIDNMNENKNVRRKRCNLYYRMAFYFGLVEVM